MTRHINTDGPSYKAGYKDGYDAAQHAVADAQATADDAYQRGYQAALADARLKWVARMDELKTLGYITSQPEPAQVRIGFTA